MGKATADKTLGPIAEHFSQNLPGDRDNENHITKSRNLPQNCDKAGAVDALRDRMAREYAARPATGMTWGLNRHLVEKLFADGWDACSRSQWHDAARELPPADDDVLARCAYSCHVASYDGRHWYDSCTGSRLSPRWWMPIPPTPYGGH